MEFEIKGLSKSYGGTVALQEVSCSLTGGIYGLLGPNGAGKSTLINSVVGLLRPDSGEILVDGTNIRSLGDRYLDYIGYMPQYPGFYKNFTAMEFLLYMAALKGVSRTKRRARCEELLEFVNLTEVGGRKIGGFSGGMRQRLGIAQALIHDPPLLILDEPTAGLDPQERIRFRNLISRLSENRIILLATHIVSDIEFIAGHVILLKKGRVVAQAPPQELVRAAGDKVWGVRAGAGEMDRYVQRYNVANAKNTDGGYELRIVCDGPPAEDAVNLPASLEDVYLYYFGETPV